MLPLNCDVQLLALFAMNIGRERVNAVYQGPIRFAPQSHFFVLCAETLDNLLGSAPTFRILDLFDSIVFYSNSGIARPIARGTEAANR